MDYRALLKRFPQFKSTAQLVVQAHPQDPALFLSIPEGRRVHVWFTYYKTKNICFLVDKKTLQPVHAAFSSDLALGTVLHGTLVHSNGKRCFVADEVCWFKGAEVKLAVWPALLECFAHLDSHIVLASQLIFALPETALVYQKLMPSYSSTCVKALHENRVVLYRPPEKTQTHQVTCTNTTDIYDLHDQQGKYVGYARVDTYKRSALLRRSFDKNEGRPLRMVCKWDAQFKQWVPLKIADGPV
jgi:hypothetical protein